MRKEIFVIILIGLLVSWGIYAVFSLGSQNDESYSVGVILPLTGAMAKAGFEAKVALEIAQNDFNSNILLLFEDDGFVPKESITGFTRLKDYSPVAIIGPLNGSSIESVRNLAIENSLPVFTPWGAGNNIGNFLYKNSVEADFEATAIANLLNSLGYTRPAIIYLQTDFGLINLNSFKKTVILNGGTLVAEEPFMFNEKDFRLALTKIKSANPDSLYIVGSGAVVGEIAKQAREIGLDVQLFGEYATEASDLIQVGGKSIEGLIYSFPLNEANLTPKQNDFIKKFEEKTGAMPQIVAYNSYDIYALIVDAVNVCKKDTLCINNYISNIKEFDGVGGKFSIVDGKLKRDFYFKTIKNGELVAWSNVK